MFSHKKSQPSALANGWLFLCVIIMLLLGNNNACSNSESSYPEHYSNKDLSDETPLTQTDIDSYINIRNKYNRATPGFNEPKVQKDLAKLAKANGLTHKRLYYLDSKLPTAMGLATGLTMKFPDYIPQSMRPTDEEIALVKLNLERIQKSMP